MRNIGSKITISVVLLLAITSLSLGLFSYFKSSEALVDQVEKRMVEKTEDTAQYIEEHFEKAFMELMAVTMHDDVRSMELERQLPYLAQIMEGDEQYLALGIVDERGESHYVDGTTADLSDRSYIQSALAGDNAMSDVIISRVTGQPVLMIATPIDTATGERAALLARIDGFYLSDITDGVKIGESGNTFLVGADGTVLAHTNRDFVVEQANFVNEAAETGKETNQSRLVARMIEEDKGLMYYTNDAGKQIVSFDRLDNGWSVATIASENEMLAPIHTLRSQLIVIASIIIVIGAVLTIGLSRSIARPIRELVGVGNYIAAGDFSQDVPARFIRRHDEVGTLAKTFASITDNMRAVVTDVNNATSEVTTGSQLLTERSTYLNELSDQVGKAMHEMEDSAETQVHMANDSAREMETMADGVTDVARVSSQLAADTDHIATQVTEGNEALHVSFQQMEQIERATDSVADVIQLLHKESEHISSITNMITQISEQTNLLALNASIEAARAGEAGAGFAIVADEVRELSHQTAQSADNIHSIVQSIQEHTNNGVKVAQTATSNVARGTDVLQNLETKFTEIVRSIENMTGEIEEMTAISEEMAAGTQEVAASLEEMAGAAQSSSELVHHVTEAANNQTSTVHDMTTSIATMDELVQQLSATVRQFKV